MATRTIGAIALRPTGNAQGGYYFLNLTTGRRINRYKWTTLPMPREVIDQVHRLARKGMATRGLAFADREGHPLLNDNDDDDDSADDYDVYNDDDYEDGNYEAPPPDIEDDPIEDAPIPIILPIFPAPIAGVYAHGHGNGDDEHAPDDANEDDADDYSHEGYDVTDDDDDDQDSQHSDDSNYSDDNDDNDDDGDHGSEQDADDYPDDEVEEAEDAEAGADASEDEDEEGTVDGKDDGEVDDDDNAANPPKGHYLRPAKPRNYDHLHTLWGEQPDFWEETIMTQYTLKKGLQQFGEKGTAAVSSELQQLVDREVMEPVHAGEMTPDKRSKALNYLMFLKEKRDGKVKGRGCADGRKQRVYIKKEYTSLPTVATEAVLLTCTIDAKEKRDVAFIDVPGAFMQTDIDDITHMRLDGTMADLLVDIDPDQYQSYAQERNGKTVLYVRLKKALYGTLKAAYLFWKKLTADLEHWGFKVNPYDRCVANKMINGAQCTVVWHVDDVKISHVDPKVVTTVIQLFSHKYGKEAPLVISRGKVHQYLGMTIDYSVAGKVKFYMKDYIENMLLELPSDMDGTSNTPAANHLFDVGDDDPTLLDEEEAEMFHRNVAKLLFLCKRARPDIQTAVSFLCTRVKAPDDDDYSSSHEVFVWQHQYTAHTGGQ
jgi:Reverse transcriptase (RNA-dependent DNA polymerase)